jgi:outer membrane cobalamin receptor
VGVFTNRWHDLIDYNFNLSRNQNIARARTEGIEGVWSMVDHRGWNYRLSSQWMQSQDELALKELVGRPRWKISGKWSVPIDQKVSLWGEGQIRGPVWQMDPSSIDGQRSLREDYGVINLGYLYHWSSDIRIYARVNNVLNQTSDELLGYSSLGRSFYAGIHWRNPSGEAN